MPAKKYRVKLSEVERQNKIGTLLTIQFGFKAKDTGLGVVQGLSQI